MSGRAVTSPQNKVNWTPEMDLVLIEGFADYVALHLIADQIGVAKGTAHRRVHELRLTRPPKPRKDRSKSTAAGSRELQFADLLADGVPPDLAGDMLGYTSGNAVLQRIRAKLGWQAV